MNGVSVEEGLFTVELDYVPVANDGGPRFLQVLVSCPAGSPFQRLDPRQEILPTPYAFYADRANTAESAATADSVHWGDVDGIPAGFADGIDDTGSDGSDHVHSSLDAPDGDPVEAVKVFDGGAVGFGKTDSFAPSAFDQGSFGGLTPVTGDVRWQSFTAGFDGRLNQIQIQISTGPAMFHFPFVSVYAGEGTGGTLLGGSILPIGSNQSGNHPFTFASPIQDLPQFFG